jgi:hypothetical protein
LRYIAVSAALVMSPSTLGSQSAAAIMLFDVNASRASGLLVRVRVLPPSLRASGDHGWSGLAAIDLAQ